MKLYNKNRTYIRHAINILITLAFAILFFTAKLFKIRYNTGINLNYFTLKQISAPIITTLFVISLIAMASLIFISPKHKKLIFSALSISIISITAMLTKTYLFITKNYAGYEKMTVNWGIYIFILLTVILFATNIRAFCKKG